jgi:membrane dipeptidase
MIRKAFLFFLYDKGAHKVLKEVFCCFKSVLILIYQDFSGLIFIPISFPYFRVKYINMSKYYFLLLLFSLSLLSTCNRKVVPVEGNVNSALEAKANELAHRFIITDGHIDLPYRLRVSNFQLTKEFMGIPIKSDTGDFDWERAREGGLDAPFMSIYIPASYQEKGGAKELADSLINMVNAIVKNNGDKFARGRNTEDVRQAFERGKIALPMGMENGAPIGDDLKNIDYFYDRGIRYITLTHSKDNQICDSSYDTTGTWGGLSPFGRKVVQRMNLVGIMVDISHVSDNTFYQVMDLTKVPCIASHSSARKFTPGFERNMSDDMIIRLAENGGVIQINFGSTFLDGKLRSERDELRNKMRKMVEDAGLEYGSDAADKMMAKYRKDNPSLFYADVELVADHIDHVVQLAGIDHVGFGSDYDGVGDSLPVGLKDVSDYPNLIYALLKRGYSEEDIAKICYKNVFRVWEAVETYAKEMQRAKQSPGKPGIPTSKD